MKDNFIKVKSMVKALIFTLMAVITLVGLSMIKRKVLDYSHTQMARLSMACLKMDGETEMESLHTRTKTLMMVGGKMTRDMEKLNILSQMVIKE